VLSCWWLSDSQMGPFSSWCATQVPLPASRDLDGIGLRVAGAGGTLGCARRGGFCSPVAPYATRAGVPMSSRGTRAGLRSDLILSAARVTGCDAGARARDTGLSRFAGREVPAGAYGSQARASPCRRQRNRESRRAPAIPTKKATSSATAFGSSTRSTATRRRRSCSFRRRRSRTRGCGRRRSPISRATFASSPSTHGGTGGRTGRTRPRPTPTGSSWRTVAPSSRRPERRRHSSPASATAAAGR
jgi:hypothetical protein